MRAVLICPHQRRKVPLLAAGQPLAAAPALGQGIVEYWMSHLACNRVEQTVILSSDRTEEVRRIVGDGSRWGVAAEVIDEAQELEPDEAAEKYEGAASVMDHFPGLSTYPLFCGYDAWFEGLEAWIPLADSPDRVGLRELRPGVWTGLHARISPKAILRPPCWLGDYVYVGPGAVIGPRSIVEKGAFVEPEANIEGSLVGPATFVGRYVQLKNSLAWGCTLVDWPSGVETKVADTFVLCSLRRSATQPPAPGFLDRIADLVGKWIFEEPIEQAAGFIKR